MMGNILGTHKAIAACIDGQELHLSELAEDLDLVMKERTQADMVTLWNTLFAEERYNLINGFIAAERGYLLTELLRLTSQDASHQYRSMKKRWEDAESDIEDWKRINDSLETVAGHWKSLWEDEHQNAEDLRAKLKDAADRHEELRLEKSELEGSHREVYHRKDSRNKELNEKLAQGAERETRLKAQADYWFNAWDSTHDQLLEAQKDHGDPKQVRILEEELAAAKAELASRDSAIEELSAKVAALADVDRKWRSDYVKLERLLANRELELKKSQEAEEFRARVVMRALSVMQRLIQSDGQDLVPQGEESDIILILRSIESEIKDRWK